MSEAYLHDVHRLADLGLQLRLPVDLVPTNQYSRLTNIEPVIEGQLLTRAGLTAIATVSANPIHSIHRLNESIPSVESVRLVGSLFSLYAARLSAPAVFQTLLTAMSGNPLSIIDFRFTQDTATWAILTDGVNMYKYRDSDAAGSAYLLQALGNAFPTVAALSIAGGSGNLNSTGGPGYDWRYTYVNGYTLTESNPSPIDTSSGGPTTTRPTTFTNPYIGGVTAFVNPANAIDGSTATAAVLTVASSVPGHPVVLGGCQWQAWASLGGQPTTVVLYIDMGVVINLPTLGSSFVNVQYSLDNGTTWKTLITLKAATVRTTFTASLTASLGFPQLLIRVIADSTIGSGPVGPTIIVSVWDIKTISNLPPVTNALALANQEASVCVTAPTLPEQLYIRLYRRGGSLPDAWRLVTQIAVSGLAQGPCGVGKVAITDNVSDTTLSGAAIMQLDNDQPVTSVQTLNQALTFMWGPVGIEARVMGCGDPNRPECVYFSKPGNADAWPPENFVEVSSPGTPILAGCSWNTRTFAFSRERVFELVEGLESGVTFSPFVTPASRGLFSPWALAVGPAMYYVAKDGVYASTGGAEESLVDDTIKPLFPTYDTAGQDVNGYEAIDMTAPNQMRLAYHNNELYFAYQGATSGTQQMLVYDILRKRWRATNYTDQILAIYSEGNTVSSLLMGTTAGVLAQTGGATDLNAQPINCVLRTGSFDQGQPLNMKEYGNVILDIDPGGATVGQPVTITPYINGEAAAESAITVTGTGRQQVPLDLSDVYAFNMEFEIAWTRTATINPVAYQLDVLHRFEPAQVAHWETRESALGQVGYQHVRDLYVAIRSNADVTLQVLADGVGVSYTVPSTSGLRRKLLVPLASNKGKLYRFIFDSAQPFRVYAADCETRAKPWLGLLGYSVRSAFGEEDGGADAQ